MSDGHDSAVAWLTRITRVGWLSKGLVFALIGVIAIRIATTNWQADADPSQTGALRVVASQPLGAVLLIVVSIGLIVFMVWNISQALIPGSTGIDPLGIAQRIGWFGLGLFYGLIAYVGFRLAITEFGSPASGTTQATDDQSSGDSASAPALTARLLDATGGRALALLIAVVVLVVAVYHLHKGLTYSFVDDLDTTDLDADTRRVIGRLGVGGFVARGVVLILVAFFLARAAITFDANEAVGLDGALRELASVSYGRILIAVAGIGLLLAGIYDMSTFRRQRLR